MDIIGLIEIIAAILIIYLFIRFIVNPMLKLVLGVIGFIILLYLLQRFFNLNLEQILKPVWPYIAPAYNWINNFLALFLKF